MMKISLDWVNLFPSVHGKFSVSQDTDIRVERLNKLYAEVFKPELGTVKGVTAKLHLKGNATPVFQRPRLVPYALRFAVQEELKRVENDGVLKPVEASNWATLIICVPKTDGSVRICGEYQGKVNPAIQTEQFAIPTLEEIRRRVSSSQVGLENVNNPAPDVETPSFLGTSLSEASSFLLRSGRVRKAPDRLIETM